MEIRGPLSIQTARAYGVAKAGVASKAAASPSAGANRLVAGTVSVPADPALGSSPAADGAFALYSRSADRVDVAVRVALGRTIDTQA